MPQRHSQPNFFPRLSVPIGVLPCTADVLLGVKTVHAIDKTPSNRLPTLAGCSSSSGSFDVGKQDSEAFGQGFFSRENTWVNKQIPGCCISFAGAVARAYRLCTVSNLCGRVLQARA